jgi:small subunit ribosomal protein S20
MAHHKSAIKRIKTSRAANLRNRYYRSLMRIAIRRVHEAETAESASENTRKACAVIDRLASKGIIHRNTAARRKSSLYHRVSQMSAPQAG